MSRKNYISSFSVIVTFVAIAILGCALLPKLPVKLAPSETLPSISVDFNMPGSAARTVEQEVTSRLEGMLARESGVKHVKSSSWKGGGRVSLEFDRNTDMEKARFETAMTVRQAWSDMPEGVSYPRISVRQVDNSASRPFMSYTVNADQTPSDIMLYAEENIKPALSRIPGVADVSLSGATAMEWTIEFDNSKLAAMGLTTATVTQAVNDYFETEFLGMAPLTSDNDGAVTRIAISAATTDGMPPLSEIAVTSDNGLVVTLDMIATLRHAEAPPTSHFRINGLNSIYLNVKATDDANQLDLSKRVKKCLDGIKFPPGYQLNLNYDASESISKELDTIYFRTAMTVLILLAFVGLITMSLRYLLLITISLAINMAVAVVAYYLLGVEIQLYSLAGITISLNLVIDNLIVMTEHITRRGNLKAFTAVLAATLTTVGALSVVFFLDEKTMLSMRDFVVVVIVNLAVSLLVALFLVPALVERMKVRYRQHSRRRKKVPYYIMRGYAATVGFLLRHKGYVYAVMILAFGIPLFLLPEKIEKEGRWADIYNKTIGAPFYSKVIRPWVDASLGGTLRLFVEKVYDGNYWSNKREEPVVSINATLPNGSTLSQMDALMRKMEMFLATGEGIRQFQTSVYSARRANIDVYFKPEYQRNGYPYRLKSEVVGKALTLGGGSWSVYGLEDNGFNNDVREKAGSYRIELRGYNYDELYRLAEEISDTLLTHKRIKEVTINTEFSYWQDDYTEFFLALDRDALALDSLSANDIASVMNREIGRNILVTSVNTSKGSESVLLRSNESDRDIWSVMNMPVPMGKKSVKLANYATVEKRFTPQNVEKEDQQYKLGLQYDYIGSSKMGDKVIDATVREFNQRFPMGYTATKYEWGGRSQDEWKQYLLLGLVAVIIFFISSILFNSLRQPLAIILVIPVAFIGVFLTFYLFKLKFDSGGFASMILLCGVTVNAAIYIINEFNSLRDKYPDANPFRLYMKAFSVKITAVLLTVMSTVLGFIPFIVGDEQESFWFPLAVGTMGGLVMSLVAIYILLPLLVLKAPKRVKKRKREKRRNKKVPQAIE